MTGTPKDTKLRDETRALEDRGAGEDGRLFSPSAARNRDVILQTLAPALAQASSVLEIASGTGEHGSHIAAALPHILWQPSDPDPRARHSVDAWRKNLSLANMATPLDLATTDLGWIDAARAALSQANGEPAPSAIVCMNMIHIAPWTACEGLFHGAGALLAPGGLVYLYGPFGMGAATVASNRAFDQDLRRRNPDWGVREREEVEACAQRNGFRLDRAVDMPANNQSLFFIRTAGS